MNSLKQKIAMAAVLLGGLLVGGVATATPITMNFDGVTPGAAVNQFYHGGCSTTGVIFTHNKDCNGPSDGVTWSGAYASSVPGLHEPSASNVMGLGLLGKATMNVAAGFDTGLSFYYTGLVGGMVDVYSGLNGRGTLLASVSLGSTLLKCGTLTCWDLVGMDFTGLAKSAIFKGLPGTIAFDDVTLGVGSRGTPVPEPAALGMFGLGVLLIGLFARSRRRLFGAA